MLDGLQNTSEDGWIMHTITSISKALEIDTTAAIRLINQAGIKPKLPESAAWDTEIPDGISKKLLSVSSKIEQLAPQLKPVQSDEPSDAPVEGGKIQGISKEEIKAIASSTNASQSLVRSMVEEVRSREELITFLESARATQQKHRVEDAARLGQVTVDLHRLAEQGKELDERFAAATQSLGTIQGALNEQLGIDIESMVGVAAQADGDRRSLGQLDQAKSFLDSIFAPTSPPKN